MRLPALLALVTFLEVVPTGAQPRQSPDLSGHQKANSKNTAPKRVDITGEVSDDGRTFTADTDSRIWQLTNPDVLPGIYGRHITIRGIVNPGGNSIEVLTVKAFASEHTHARLDDAAFRR